MPESICNATTSVLDVCEKIELSCADLYHFFAELFKNDRDHLLMWLNAAMEAENCARHFALVGKLQRHNIIASIGIELLEAEVTLIYVQSVRDKVAATPPDLRGALECALQLERKIARCKIENVLHFADPSYGRSFLGSDSRRQALLNKTYQKLCG